MFELMENNNSNAPTTVIKVIGVGGGGGNAINYMMDMEMQGVELFCANTDLQALESSPVKNKLQLGKEITRGLGAGADPEIGQKSALEDHDKIMSLLQGTDMLFIAAGMGGGTGTGAAPVIADIAKQAGVLTVAVVTKPFTFEGKQRKEVAKDGIRELSKHVDSIILVSNDRLLSVMGKSASVSQAFNAANGVLYGAVNGISEQILKTGLINVDFRDVKAVMVERGIAMMGTGSATGEDRAKEAIEKAISSPLLENIDLSTAKGVLVNVTAGEDFGMLEFNIIGETIDEITHENPKIVYGLVLDPEIDDEVRITVVATGIDNPDEASADLAVDQIQKAKQQAGIQQMHQNSKSESKSSENKKSGYLDLDIPAFLKKKVD